jgi:hypothetical protein
MSWFSRSSRKDSERGTATAETEPGPESHRSQALAALFAEVRKRPRVTVLDLGPALGSNVEFLSQFGCRLVIADLWASLASRQPSGEEGDLAGPAFFEDAVAAPDSGGVDVILAWDLFDYLKKKELAHLGARLGKLSRPGTLLFTQVTYVKQMPAQPRRFRILSEETLGYERRTALDRPAPRYAPAEVRDLLRGFTVDRSFLLRHGIQEYLLVREEG